MNLRVDLILKDEQRSANLINVRLILRITSVVVPVFLGLLVFTMVLNMMNLRNRVRLAESVWKEAEPRKAQVLKLRERLAVNEHMLRELEGWKASQMAWNAQLRSVQQAVRPTTQLTGLRVEQTVQLVDNKKPARIFRLTLEGYGAAETAEGDVEALQRSLRSGGDSTQHISAVSVPKFGADRVDREGRSFQVECEFNPLFF